MSLKDYLKDHVVSLAINFFTIALMWFVLRAFNCNAFLTVYVPVILIVSFIACYSYDYLRKRSYYQHFLTRLNDLDEKYLVTELLEKPHFLEAKIMFDSIYEIDKSMKEHLNEVIFKQSELKEYIEMWCHEIKTPVATSQMITANNPSVVTDSINEELTKIDDYVEQVLFYARSEAVEKDYLIKEIKLKDVINTVIKRNKKDLISKRIKIKLDDLEVNVLSDKKWLEFILHQVINNAIKYIQEEPMIHIYSKTKHDSILLMIEDNGIGISENEIGRVFDKGFTGTNGRNHQKSTGIGLYLCKKLCLRLNHEIKITSNQQGTTVIIEFPINSYLTLK